MDFHCRPEDEFGELVLENGQIVMQSQSSRQRKRAREKDGKASGRSKITRFCDKDLSRNPANVGSNDARDDGLVPWIDEGLENDYGDEFLNEFLGFGAGPPTPHAMAAGRSGCSAQEGRTPGHVAPTVEESDAGGSDAAQDHHCKVIAVMASSKQMQQPSGTTTTLMNFSHFARPVALAKVCLRNGGGGGLRNVEKLSTLSSSNTFASTPIQRSNGVKDVRRASGAPSSTMKSLREAGLGEQPTPRKNLEAAAASMCSGNFAGAGMNQRKHGERRKEGGGEESEFNSEDLQDEGVGIRRHSRTKRSRVAEVHNLSEKRRRNKINEKMRALQQLLPHCDKVDKVSVLDEAIEYLKTLQLQVQMMSMRSRLCMPPMVLPPPVMAHLPGVGMRVYDMNCSPGFAIVAIPRIHAPQFPWAPAIPGLFSTWPGISMKTNSLAAAPTHKHTAPKISATEINT
ncbi:hypothetical protein MUK42_36991 [Musa troglodytarum]|uniref:BHLH domain-containing protein n=1 Tax=Musa troglodytarum TaxID=320322 RepID=A0A9E7JT82_9LILI|nr:hypothetical protein MUK42_36991 [Musa troglodytarum]URD93379.1 hypothetical protein MUK42_36991 [Musa troglodytarum]URD93380.1 hypothetical protein MUK42_36991 [Musa troglodytarum]URD93382.1 hypothetical protein MUK42_36991 [Musa troglodytarum]